MESYASANAKSHGLEQSLFFTRLVAYTGGALTGYKKAKSVARIGFSEQFHWDRDFFGADSSFFESALNSAIAHNYLSEFLLPTRMQPIHHKYVLTPDGMELFLKSPTPDEEREDLANILVWASLPAKYSVGYVLAEHPVREKEKVTGQRIIDSYPLMSEHRVEKLLQLYRNWKIKDLPVIALEESKNSYTLKINPEYVCRYEYLRDFSTQAIETDFKETTPLLSSRNPVFTHLVKQKLVDEKEVKAAYEKKREQFLAGWRNQMERVDKTIQNISRFYQFVSTKKFILSFDHPYVKLRVPDEGITQGEESQIKHALQVSELLSLLELRKPEETLSLIWG